MTRQTSTDCKLQVVVRFDESNLTAPNMAAKVRSVVIAIVTRPGMDSETDSMKLFTKVKIKFSTI